MKAAPRITTKGGFLVSYDPNTSIIYIIYHLNNIRNPQFERRGASPVVREVFLSAPRPFLSY